MAKKYANYKTKETKATKNTRNTKKAPQISGVETLKQCLEKEDSQHLREALDTLSNLDDIQNIADTLFRTEYGINDMMSAIERTDKDTPSYAQKDLDDMCKYLANISTPMDIDVINNIVSIEKYFSIIVKDNDGKKDNTIDKLMKVINIKEYGMIDGVMITDRVMELTASLTTSKEDEVPAIKEEIKTLEKIQDDIFMAGIIMIIRDTMKYYNEKVKKLEAAEEEKNEESTKEETVDDESKDIVIEDVTDDDIKEATSHKTEDTTLSSNKEDVIDAEIVSEETVIDTDNSNEKSGTREKINDTDGNMNNAMTAMNMILTGFTELMKNVNGDDVLDTINKLASVSMSSKSEPANNVNVPDINKSMSDVLEKIFTSGSSSTKENTTKKKSVPNMASILNKLGGVNNSTKETTSSETDNTKEYVSDEAYEKRDPDVMRLLRQCGRHACDIVEENVTPSTVHGNRNMQVIAYDDVPKRNMEIRIYEDTVTHDLYTMRILLN